VNTGTVLDLALGARSRWVGGAGRTDS